MEIGSNNTLYAIQLGYWLNKLSYSIFIKLGDRSADGSSLFGTTSK